jgi:hypothetical protein
MSAAVSVLYPVRVTSERIGCFARGNPGHSLFQADEWFRLADTLQLSPREVQIVQQIFCDHHAAIAAFEVQR